MLGFLTREEMLEVLGQPGLSWTSQRDHLLLAMLYNTGARVSEIIGVERGRVVLDGAACVHLHGKGRKQRSVPLWKATVQEIRAWLRLNPHLHSEAALLPNRDGRAMTRCNVALRLELAVSRAAVRLPSIAKKQVSPHTLRHTTAMHLLQSGVPFNVIALWLGHESTTTTHRYVEADLAMKEKALTRLQAPDTRTHGSGRRTHSCGSCRLCNYAQITPAPNAVAIGAGAILPVTTAHSCDLCIGVAICRKATPPKWPFSAEAAFGRRNHVSYPANAMSGVGRVLPIE